MSWKELYECRVVVDDDTTSARTIVATAVVTTPDRINTTTTTTNKSSKPKVVTKKASSNEDDDDYNYDKAKEAICSLPGMDKEEVVTKAVLLLLKLDCAFAKCLMAKITLGRSPRMPNSKKYLPNWRVLVKKEEGKPTKS